MQRGSWVAFAALAVGAGIIVAAGNALVVLGTGLVGALAIWFASPRSPDKTPRLFILFVWAFAFAELLPSTLQLGLAAIALSGGIVVWLRRPPSERRGEKVVPWAMAILGYWGLLLLVHPNVPSLSVGALGYRQSVLAVAGLILGCALDRRCLEAAEVSTVKAITTAMSVSIVSFLWFPQLAARVTRAADQYTALYQGQPRLQGIFAGPFHAATGAAILLCWVLARASLRAPHKILLVLALVAGGLGLQLAAVRTAYIAVALAGMATVLLARTGAAFAGRAFAIVSLAAIGYYAFMTGDDSSSIVSSISNYSTDSRFLHRLPEYQLGLHLFWQSPIFGWGPGSAADTLGTAFVNHIYVTPHNIVLKLAVEGGLLGLVLWSGLLVQWWRSITPRSREGRLAVLLVLALLGFGTTGSAIDTLPLSYFILLFAGLAVRGILVRPQQHVAHPADGDALAGDEVDEPRVGAGQPAGLR